MIRPQQLPRIRDRMATLLAGETGDAAARHLHGELYWATSDMAALATAAGRDLDTIRWAAEDRPSPTGLLVMDGGIGWWPGRSVDAPVDAVSWGPAPGGLLLTFWVAAAHRLAIMHPRQTRAGAADLPPLVPLGGRTVAVHINATPAEEIDTDLRAILTTVWAAWQLMSQPTLAELRPAVVDRTLTRSYGRAGRGQPEVTIVDLRRLYQPGDREGEDEGRTYRHRWVVRGHWRNQAHGPGRSERRRIYVPSYVKGPNGRPLLTRERVNVWRR